MHPYICCYDTSTLHYYESTFPTRHTVEGELRVDDDGGSLLGHHRAGVQVSMQQTLCAGEEETLQAVDG